MKIWFKNTAKPYQNQVKIWTGLLNKKPNDELGVCLFLKRKQYRRTVFPLSAKKCKIFFAIFALIFCEVLCFSSCQKPAFLFPEKN